MSDFAELLSSIMAVAMIFFVAGVFAGNYLKQKAMDTAIIEHGCAYYAPDTGEFTWMNNKE